MKQLRFADDSGLDRFVHSGAEFPLGKSLESRWIDQYELWLIEGAYQVLPCSQIHTGLSPDGSVQLRLHGGGNLHEPHTTHINRCEHSGNVTDDAASESNNESLAVGTEPDEIFRELVQGSHALVSLAVAHLDEGMGNASGVERSRKHIAPPTTHGCDRDHECAGCLAAKDLGYQFAGADERAVLDHGFVGVRLGVDWNAEHWIHHSK